MKIVLSKKFQDRWDVYLDYCLSNYGTTIADKKLDNLSKILRRLTSFPESGFLEPLLKEYPIQYRAVLFDKRFKIIYFVDTDTIMVENFWDTTRSPKFLKKDI